MTIKFSIVIPLYNKQDHINRAIDSVIQQNIANIEVLVVDDGSTDSSADRVRQIKDSRVKLVKQSNAGVAVARNTGIEKAQGDYVTFLDADDAYTVDFLSEVSQLIKKFPDAGMYCTAYEFVNPQGGSNAARINVPKTIKHQLINDYFKVCAQGDLLVSSSSVCIPKAVLNQLGGFPADQSMGEDQNLWSKIALQFSTAFSTVIGSKYFLDADNRLMNTIKVENEMPFAKELQLKLDAGRIKPELKKSVQSYIAAHLLDLIRRNYTANRLDVCHHLLADKRIRAQPLRLLYWSLKVYSATKFLKRNK